MPEGAPLSSASPSPSTSAFPDDLEVVIDVPRLGFIKRDDAGHVDFISPLPCPFNYGSVPNTLSGDGDREDAVVLGAALPRGTSVRVPVVARVDFVDAGLPDPKWICSFSPLTSADQRLVSAFFGFYAHSKGMLNRVRGKSGVTRYRGLQLR
jgi:inorganic pyrophosphatase